jgi:hypothetical protein
VKEIYNAYHLINIKKGCPVLSLQVYHKIESIAIFDVFFSEERFSYPYFKEYIYHIGYLFTMFAPVICGSSKSTSRG